MIQVGSRAWFIGMIHFTLMIGWLEYHKNGTHQNGLFCSASLNTSSFLLVPSVLSPHRKPNRSVWEELHLANEHLNILGYSPHSKLGSYFQKPHFHGNSSTAFGPSKPRNFMMAESPLTPRGSTGTSIPLDPPRCPKGVSWWIFFPPKNRVNTISVCLFVYWICVWNRRLSFCCVKLEVRI